MLLRLLPASACLQYSAAIAVIINLLTIIPFHTLSLHYLRAEQLPILSFEPSGILWAVEEGGNVEDVGEGSCAHVRDDGS